MVYYNKTSNLTPPNIMFKTISQVMNSVPDAHRPPGMRRWDFWKLDRADKVVLVDITVFGKPTLITFGGDALRLAATIGLPVEYYSMGDVTVPTLSVPKAEMGNLAAHCNLHKLPFEIVI